MTSKDIPEPSEAVLAKKTRHLRAPIEIRIEITLGRQSFTATSRNLALGGVSFETLESLNEGDKVNILLYIPVNKELELLKASSTIKWVKDMNGSLMVGAGFDAFAPGDEKRHREWMLECVRAQKMGNFYI